MGDQNKATVNTSPSKRLKPGAAGAFTPKNTFGSPRKFDRDNNTVAPIFENHNISDLGSSLLSVNSAGESPLPVKDRPLSRTKKTHRQEIMVREREAESQPSSQNSRNGSSQGSGRTPLMSTSRQPVGARARVEGAKVKPSTVPSGDVNALTNFFDDEGPRDTATKAAESTPPNISRSLGSKLVISQPQFGQASPLRNPLDRTSGGLFNVPKPGQRRPEHHRPASGSMQPRQYRTPGLFDANPANTAQVRKPLGGVSPLATDATDRTLEQMRNMKMQSNQPTQPARSSLPDVYEVPRPTFARPGNVQAAPRPTFTTTSFQPVNYRNTGSSAARPMVDLTQQDDDEINPDEGLRDVPFGAPDPYSYVDAGAAQDNIKALLEGAFDDEAERPRLRRRPKKTTSLDKKAVDSLADKLAKIDVKEQAESDDVEEDEDDGSVEGLAVKLLPHQVDGVAWMLEKETASKKKTLGGILADDMGLGKTIQSIALMLENPRLAHTEDTKIPKKDRVPTSVAKSTLVVAPLALIKQWESEIKEKVSSGHGLRVLVHHGPSRTRSGDLLKKNDVVITTYQTLTSEHAASDDNPGGAKVGCFGVHWYRIFLDEAHSIKNRNAKSTKACYGLRSHYRWCLTGTPMQNNLDELQSLIQFLQIKPYSNYTHWKEQITTPMKNNRGNLAMRRIQVFLKACMKRRTKDVLKKDGALYPGGKKKDGDESRTFQIVERNVDTVVAEFNDVEREFYDKLAARAQNSLDQMMSGEKTDYIGALVLLLRLRQACNHPELVGGASKDMGMLGSPVKGGGRKAVASTDGDLDDIADMFGNMTVEAKKCEICQQRLKDLSLSKCAECQEDLEKQRRTATDSKSGSMKSKMSKKGAESKAKRDARRQRMRRVVDSDDEDDNSEGEGSWLVSEDKQKKVSLDKAGDTDDENIEGGGEWLRSDDSETDVESEEAQRTANLSNKTRGLKNRKSKKPRDSFVSDDETTSSEDSDSDASRIDASLASLASTSSLSTLTSSTKIRHMIKLLKTETPSHKVIVFSQFTSMLDLMEPFLNNAKIAFTRYDGSMRNDIREASLNRLRTDDKCRVLLCSLKCGSLGLNLTVASRVIIMEPFWNPFVEEQAIDRVHRLNQKKDVQVYRLTIANTVEERILELQEAKRKLAKTALEGGAKGNMNISMADILKLFHRDAEREHPVDGVEDENGHDERSVAAATGGRLGVLDGERSRGTQAKAKPEKAERVEHPLYGRR